MGIRTVTFGALVLLLGVPAAVAQNKKEEKDATPAALAGPRLRVGVLELSGTALSVQSAATPVGTSTTIALAPPPDFSRGLTQMLTTALVAQQSFVVLERAQMAQVMGEQEFSNSGRVTPETSISIGKLLGAQVLITGDITEFNYKASSTGGKLGMLGGVVGGVTGGAVQSLGAKADKVTALVALDLRVLDATTGEVLGSARGEGKASATAIGADLAIADKSIGIGGSVDTPLGQASRRAIEKAVQQLAGTLRDAPWSGRVGEVRAGEVYINAGSQVGVAAGMEFDVFQQGRAVTDPATGSVLGAPETRIGRIAIVRVAPKYAVGKVIDGKGFKRNDVVRFKGATAEKS